MQFAWQILTHTPIWAFVLVTLVAAIDQSHPGVFTPASMTLSSISGD